jgi:hypothetical protein
MVRSKVFVAVLFGLVAYSLVACSAAKTPAQRLPVATGSADTFPTRLPPTQEVIKDSDNPTNTAPQTLWWEPYENALVRAILPTNTTRAVCEWVVLGCIQYERYVWVYCTGYLLDGVRTAASLPAVLVFAADGKLFSVRVPGEGSDYSRDVTSLFPPAIQKQMSGQSFVRLTTPPLEQHALERLSIPQLPPLAAAEPICP